MILFEMTDHPIGGLALRQQLENPACGACAVFEGWVRDHHEGREVRRLEYEAYVPVAEKEGLKILAEAREQFGIDHVICVHRTGRLELGDCAVWVGVASAHRDEAFKACRFIIDEAKYRLPIWKKEYYVNGDATWVNCQRCAEHAENSTVKVDHG